MSKIKVVHLNTLTLEEDPPENALEFSEWLSEKVSQIPEEFKESAEVDIKLDNFSLDRREPPIPYLEVFYYREQSQEEIDFEKERLKELQEKVKLLISKRKGCMQ